MLAIKKSMYGLYDGNYGVPSMRIDVGSLALWFLEDTVVAFHEDGYSRRVSENLWGSTTGKHLNAIDGGDRKSRLPREEFEKQLNDVLVAHGLIVE